jgi:hypothetical protein
MSDPHYAAVGRVAATWANLEHQLQFRIWKLAGLDTIKGTCITAQIGNSARLLDCLIALVLIQPGNTLESVKDLKSFAERVGNKQRTRNRIVHDPWYFHTDLDGRTEAWRLELSAAKRPIAGPISEPTHRVKQFIGEIESLISELRRLVPLESPAAAPSP